MQRHKHAELLHEPKLAAILPSVSPCEIFYNLMTQLWTVPLKSNSSGYWVSDYPREPHANRRPATHISGAIEMQIHKRYILSTSPGDTYFKQFHLQCKFIMGKYCALKLERGNLLLKVYRLYPDFCPLRTRKTLDLCGCTDRIAKMPCNTSSYTSVWAALNVQKDVASGSPSFPLGDKFYYVRAFLPVL